MNEEYTPFRDRCSSTSKESLAEPAVRDFARFYMERAATDLVSDVGYVPITEAKRDENLGETSRPRSLR